jgi:hypothetical protein
MTNRCIQTVILKILEEVINIPNDIIIFLNKELDDSVYLAPELKNASITWLKFITKFTYEVTKYTEKNSDDHMTWSEHVKKILENKVD